MRTKKQLGHRLQEGCDFHKLGKLANLHNCSYQQHAPVVASMSCFKGTVQFFDFFNIASFECDTCISDTASLGLRIKKRIIAFASHFLLVSLDGGGLLLKSVNTGRLYAVHQSAVSLLKSVGDILPNI